MRNLYHVTATKMTGKQELRLVVAVSEKTAIRKAHRAIFGSWEATPEFVEWEATMVASNIII